MSFLKKITFLLFLAGFFVLMACSGGALFTSKPEHSDSSYRKTRATRFQFKKFGFEESPQFDVPIVVNDRVNAWIDYFQGSGRKLFHRYMERSGRYQEMMRTTLRQKGLPEDLVYMAMIESGFNNHAYSRARAVGPWQFIYATGRRYGLKRDYWVDERRDPEKATQGAADYLADLYARFGDWYLVMAAYNAGEGKIDRAIRGSHSRDFWHISRPGTHYLRSETKNYVPKFIAAAIISKSPEQFGFPPIEYHEPLNYEKVRIEGQLDLKIAARLADSNVEEIQRLNPELRRGATPSGSDYDLKVPTGKKVSFEVALAELPKKEYLGHGGTHHVQSGENASVIARHYGINTRSLLAANSLNRSSILHVGQRLIIPGGYTSPPQLSPDGTHRVRRGESASVIAKRYHVRLSDLLLANNLTQTSVIRIGQKLVVPGKVKKKKPEPVTSDRNLIAAADTQTAIQIVAMAEASGESTSVQTHVVRSGDTLWDIAKEYNVSISALKEQNQLTSSRLRPGDKIQIPNR